LKARRLASRRVDDITSSSLRNLSLPTYYQQTKLGEAVE
jgi:hypothetical protein